MHTDENKEGKALSCPTKEELLKLSGGRIRLDRKFVAQLAINLHKCSEERDASLKLLDKFEKQIYAEKLYMMDEVFIPADFGFHDYIEEDKDTGFQYIMYIGDNAILSRSNEGWKIKSATLDITAIIDNAYEAYNLFNCLGIAYKIIQY